MPVTPLENHRTPKFDARGIQAALKNMANNQVAFFFCPLDLAPLMTEVRRSSRCAALLAARRMRVRTPTIAGRPAVTLRCALVAVAHVCHACMSEA